jgi:hypothetical protein
VGYAVTWEAWLVTLGVFLLTAWYSSRHARIKKSLDRLEAENTLLKNRVIRLEAKEKWDV